MVIKLRILSIGAIIFAINALWLIYKSELSLKIQLLIPIISVVLCFACAYFSPQYLRKKHLKTAINIIFIYYCAIAISMLFIGEIFHIDRNFTSEINPVPFETINRFFQHYRTTGSIHSLFNLVGNILILMPLGALLPLVFRKMSYFLLFFPTICLITASIEISQFVLDRGTADVDDFILNVLGALLGFIIIKILRRFNFG